jgi:PTS system ascorbate-specific IIA component
MEGSVATTAVVLGARVRVAARDWKAAVRAAAAPLLEAQAITGGYVDRCIALVEQNGPYIVVAPGIALAHARPEDGAVALALSAATLTEPVRFGHPTNDPVDIVLAFASPDRDAHVGLLAALARHLTQGLDQQLRTARSEAAAVARLQEVVDDVDQ